MIAINQVGWRPADTKYAIAPGALAGLPFVVVDAASDAVALTGTCSAVMHDAATDTDICRADLSALTVSGVYRVSAGNETSYPFSVDERAYDGIWQACLRMLYLQRCGVELPAALAGPWAHPACHDTPARIWETDRFVNVNGGWHDAGDYGRYVVPGVKTVMDLLLLYEAAGEHTMVTTDALDIPESGNGVPDLLDEARFELEWMQRMQDATAGGVYHKVSCRTFPGMVMPEKEREELVAAPISDAATADFAAIMAKASVVYLPFDAAFAETCLACARRAWAYLMARPEWTGFVNPEGLRTGGYGDGHVEDEVFFAAVELSLAGAGDADTDRIIEENLTRPQHVGLGWAEMSGYALYELAARRGDVRARAMLLEKAEAVLNAVDADGYGCSLGGWYGWGSNMIVANNGMLLLLCDRLAPNTRFREAAQRQLDILLGMNGLNRCYVSGFGADPMRAPHHRPSQACGQPMPGMLAGGPNMHLQDAVARETLTGRAPALCYVDDFRSYSTNEIAIYWNSPLIFLLGAI